MNSNGCFIIPTNNMVWHSFNKHQRKKIPNLDGITSLQEKTTLFKIKYTPSVAQLQFFVDERHLVKLYNVKHIKSESLIPCLIVLKDFCVKTTFDYPY